MPDAKFLRCRLWRHGETFHSGPLSTNGLCCRCIFLLKSKGGKIGGSNAGRIGRIGKQKGGRIGGRTCGKSKQRMGTANGRYLKRQNNFRTWTTLPFKYEDFKELLLIMHNNRNQSRKNGKRRQRNFLALKDVPVAMHKKYDMAILLQVVGIMATTKFCNLDRYQWEVASLPNFVEH